MSVPLQVFVDNYLDGGYHVPVAHKALTGNLDLSTYRSYPLGDHFIQSCASQPTSDRLGGTDALYIFQYPNLMINRYGSWMDTNTVYPISENRCRVKFDWFVTPDLAGELTSKPSAAIAPHSLSTGTDAVNKALADSEIVQQEDIFLCERVQRGLMSDGYDVGRYAPTLEGGEYAFHQRLYQDLNRAAQLSTAL